MTSIRKSFLEGLTDDVEDLYAQNILSKPSTNNLYSTPYAPLPRPSPRVSVETKPQNRKRKRTEGTTSSDEPSKGTESQARQTKRKRDYSVFDVRDAYNASERQARLELPPPLEPCRPEFCSYCGSDDVIEDTRQGEMVCRQCGSVLQEHIVDVTSEWQNYGDGDDTDKSRAYNVYDPIMEETNFTTIGVFGGGTKKAKMVSASGKQIKRRHDFAAHNLTEKEKFLAGVVKSIEQYADRLNMPGNPINRAKEIFKIYFDHIHKTEDTTSKQSMKKATRREALICAAVIIGSQYECCFRTLADFSHASGLSKRVINIGVTALRNVIPPEYLKQRSTPSMVAEYFMRSLDCSKEFVEQTCQLAENLHNHDDLSGRAKSSVAACALHIMCVITGIPQEVRYKVLENTDVAKYTISKTLRAVPLETVRKALPEGVDMKVPLENARFKAF